MPERFLVSRLSSLGDVVCSLPAAGALKAGFPGCHISWVVDRRFADLVRLCRHVDEAIVTESRLGAMLGLRLPGSFDAALDLQGLLKSSIPVARAKAKLKLGHHWLREGAWLFSRRVLPDPSSLHVVDQYVDVARAAGGKAHEADFGLQPAEKDVAEVERRLDEKGVEGRFVVVNAGAAWATKRWPPEYFANVIDAMGERGIRSVLIGTRAPSDVEIAVTVAQICRHKPVSMLGETSVGQLVALIGIASAHLGGDTGSTHIAAAVGRPAVGLYSITRPERSCPYGQIERCLYHPEGLARITPQDAIAKLEEALS